MEDRINLSYYLIRLGQLDEAMQVLRDPQAQRSGHFMVYANQATIHQMWANSGPAKDRVQNLSLARFIWKDALRAWPRKGWPGWDKDQASWYRQVEDYNRAMIDKRLQEAREQVERKVRSDDKPFEDVDALFPPEVKGEKQRPLRFVAEDGQYRAGQLAAAERAKLKGNEVAIVQQLLTWLPRDDRLYWLFGELLNARAKGSDVGVAALILDECVWTRKLANVPVLLEHRRVLNARPEQPSWLQANWHYLAIGGVGGLLLAVLAYFQMRENRRRRFGSMAGKGNGPPGIKGPVPLSGHQPDGAPQ